MRLARPHLLKLKPYTSARDEFSGEAEVFLDANENAFGSPLERNFHRYPDPHQHLIKEKLAAWRGVDTNQIFLGNGSDEPIELLIRAFCEPGRDHVLLTPPTYGMYEVSADINHVKTVACPLTPDYQLATSEVISSFRPGTKITFLCSPNNPSGNALDLASIRQVVQFAPGMVVVDEAYIDFAPEKSVIHLLGHFPNLVVLQTFSKAWGMAGLRLGVAYGHPSVIALLNNIKPPYNVNAFTQEQALAALAQIPLMEERVGEILAQRAFLEKELVQLLGETNVYPSDANFLLVKVPDADKWYRDLMLKGVIVRNRNKAPQCQGCLRITVGTAQENEALLAAIRSFLG